MLWRQLKRRFPQLSGDEHIFVLGSSSCGVVRLPKLRIISFSDYVDTVFAGSSKDYSVERCGLFAAKYPYHGLELYVLQYGRRLDRLMCFEIHLCIGGLWNSTRP